MITNSHRFQSLVLAVNSTRDDAYFAALVENRDLGAIRGIDGALKKFGVDVLVLPSACKLTTDLHEIRTNR